jgi:hypothetical protein
MNRDTPLGKKMRRFTRVDKNTQKNAEKRRKTQHTQ